MKRILLVVLALMIYNTVFAQDLSFYTCNVGQGDGIIITTTAGKSMLIDGGSTNAARDTILARLKTLGIQKLDYIVASHYDADHIGNIARILAAGIDVDTVFDRGTTFPSTTQTYANYEVAVNPKRHTIEPGQIIDMGAGVRLTCEVANGRWSAQDSLSVSDENERSIGLLLEYGDFRFFTGGDLQGSIEDTVGSLVGNVDVLKVAHHGSKNSSSTIFLNRILPEAALISVGSPNAYDHPAQETLNRLDSLSNIKVIYQTTSGDGGTSSKVKVEGTILTQVWPDSFVIGTDVYKIGAEKLLPEIAVSADTLDFGDVLLDSIRLRGLTIYNRGLGDLVISHFVLSDTISFALDKDSVRIAPGDSQAIIISLRPKTEKSYHDTLTIESNDTTLRVLLLGSGKRPPEPLISVRPDTLNFGEVLLADDAKRNFTIFNSGSAVLFVSGIAARDTLSFKANISTAVIAPGDSEIVTVTFKPTSAISYLDTLIISNNDSTLAIPIRGRGKMLPQPVIVLNQDSLRFGKSYLYSQSSKSFTIYNSGTAELLIDSLVVNSKLIFAIGLDSLKIAPGDSQAVSVTFIPSLEANYRDSIRIFSNSQAPILYLTGAGESAFSFESSSGNLSPSDTTGQYDLWLKLDKMAGNPVAKLILSREGAASFPDTIECVTGLTTGMFTAAIPAGREGSVWNYYFELTSEWGETRREPADAPNTTFTIRVTTQMAGDINGDGKIDVFDLLALLKQLSNPNLQTISGDIDSNGKMDVFDLLSLLKKLSSH